MSSRANVVLIGNGGYKLHFGRWAGQHMDENMFWGPEYALDYVTTLEEVGQEDWLNEDWAEGGSVIDPEQHVVLFWGGEDLLYDVPLRRTYLDLARRIWAGWTVRWAHEGVADMADYVGYPRERLLTHCRTEWRPDANLAPPKNEQGIITVGSVRHEDGRLQHYPLPQFMWGSVTVVSSGERLLESAQRVTGHEQLRISGDFPWGGFFVDQPQRTVAFWEARPIGDAASVIRARWPGWDVQWWEDEYEHQLQMAEGTLWFPARERSDLTAQVRQMLLRETGYGVVEDWDYQRRRGIPYEFDPFMHRGCGALRWPLDVCEKIIDRAIAEAAG